MVPGRAPVLLVGNEGVAYAAVVPPGVEVVRYRGCEFMADRLGIRLRPEVLPLSNLAGYLPPDWLAPGLAMRKA